MSGHRRPAVALHDVLRSSLHNRSDGRGARNSSDSEHLGPGLGQDASTDVPGWTRWWPGGLVDRLVALDRVKAAADAEGMVIMAELCERAEFWVDPRNNDGGEICAPVLVADKIAPARRCGGYQAPAPERSRVTQPVARSG